MIIQKYLKKLELSGYSQTAIAREASKILREKLDIEREISQSDISRLSTGKHATTNYESGKAIEILYVQHFYPGKKICSDLTKK